LGCDERRGGLAAKASACGRSQDAIKRYRYGTHRVVDPKVTAARIRSAATRLGITRAADVTGLDYLGVPVTMVVRPASRNLSVVQGKGLTPEAAMASGLMEAVESYCSERISGAVRIATIKSTLRERHSLAPQHLMRAPLRADARVPWTECTDLLSGQKVTAPSELIFADFSSPPPEGQGIFVATTNGLAAGNTLAEAVLHALCEVIERDAVALWMMRIRHGRAPHPLSDPERVGPASRELLTLLDKTNMLVHIWDVTSDLDVPSYVCAIDDQRSGRAPPLGRFFGSGCHSSADVAVCRAITEAAQTRATIIVGARDDIDPILYQWMASNAILARYMAGPTQRRDVEDRSFSAEDLLEDVSAVIRRLEARGIDRVLYAELPSPLDVAHCVRVLAPQLEGVVDKPWYKPGRRALALAKMLQ